MWTSTGELLTDSFGRDVAEILDMAVEYSVRNRSRKFSYPELLWAIITSDTAAKRFEDVAADKKTVMNDIKKIISVNLLPTIDERNCIDTLSYMILQDKSGRSINYFERNNWSDVLKNIFSEIEASSKGACQIAPDISFDSLAEFCFPLMVLVVFKHLGKLPSDERKYLEDLLNVNEITRSVETYIKAGSSSVSVFDAQQNLVPAAFKKNAYGIVQNSLKLAGCMGYNDVKPMHLFLSFVDDREGFGGRAIMRYLPVDESLKSLQTKLEKSLSKGPNVPSVSIPANMSGISERVQAVLEDALLKSRQSGKSSVTGKQLLLSLLDQGGEMFNLSLTNSFGVDVKSLKETTIKLDEDEKQRIVLPLELCSCSELTEGVLDNSAPEIYGRDSITDEIVKIFFRKQNRNILLYGDKGIGKTAMATALAYRIARGEVDFLKDYPVVYMDISDIPEDELRSKAFRLLNNMEENHKRIYVVDGFYRLYKVCPDLCKSSLKKNKYYFMGIISTTDYSAMNKGSESFRDYFEFLQLNELSQEAVVRIVENAASGLALEYDVEYEPNLYNRLVKFCSDFLISERFPAKAINLLNLACSNASYEKYSSKDGKGKTVVTRDHIAGQVAQLTGLPIDIILGKGEGEDYVEVLGKSIMGQERAVSKVASRLKLVKAGMVEKNLPPAVFLFIGLSGTGKTELATEIAKVYSNSRKLITYTMENFTEKHNVSGIIGTSAGYTGYEDGGKLINDLNNDPYSVVLFDEIEKAHPTVWDPMLELFDKGNIRDLRGTIAYGNKAFFILTSNIGYEKIHTMLEENKSMEEIDKAILEELYSATHRESGQKCFRPEFIGRVIRLGGIVVFNPLSHMAIKKITKKVIGKFCDDWKATREGELVVEPEVIDYIAQLSFDENMNSLNKVQKIDWLNYNPQSQQSKQITYKGGRIIFNLIDELIKNPLSERISELHSAKEVRVVKTGETVDIVCDATGEKSAESGENMKSRITAEILNSLSDLNDSTDRVGMMPLRKVEKVKSHIDEILMLIKDL